jgi:dipeptidyl aminopeptidase/acylaminoacyl peptidase
MPGIKEYLQARIAVPLSWSHDGSRLMVGSNLTGTMQLYQLDPEAEPEAEGLVQLTAEDEPVTGRFLPASDDIIVQKDEKGNERQQIYQLDPDGSLNPLVVDPAWIHLAGSASRDGRLLAYATNRSNGVDFEIVVRELGSGRERTVFSGGLCSAAAFSPDGRTLGVIRSTDRAGDNELWLVDITMGERRQVAPHDDQAEVSGPVWLPDGSGFYFTTDAGRDVAGVAFYDVAGDTWDYVLEPGWDSHCSMDWEGRHLLIVENQDGFTRAELRTPESLDLQAEVPLPGQGVATEWVFPRDGDRLAFFYSSARIPGDTWCFDPVSGRSERLTRSPVGLDLAHLVEPELHRFESFDGESIPAMLYRPAETAGEPAPAVVVVHGGPESQARPAWNPLISYLVDAGYNVAVPNVRGSTGYGKRYQHLDDRRKRLDSVADLAALHDWLEGLSGVDAARAALFGGSYGGYMVLAGLVFQPDRWAAGIDVVGISSLVTFLENTSAYRRRAREREYGFLDTDRDFLAEASPLTHIDQLRAPLLIIHGANDPRVPLSEAQQLHAALEAKGIRSELLVYEDEGHGLQKLANRLDAYPRAVAFLNQVLSAGTPPAPLDTVTPSDPGGT